jgi:N-acetylmuramoyl-L-alanine amidase
MPGERSTRPVRKRARRVVVVAAITLAGGMVAGGVAGATSGSHAGARARAGVRAAGPGVAFRAAVRAGADGRAVDPGLFSAGACVAFSPTSGDRHQTVFLDAGHGGVDPGAVGTSQSGAVVEESAVNLAVELDVLRLLRARGFTVVVSRTQNSSVTRLTAADMSAGVLSDQGAFADVAARDVCADRAGADVLVGIYMDGGPAGSAGCLTGWDADRPFSAANLRLATLLQGDVLAALNARGWAIPDDGVVSDSGLGSALTSAAVAYHHLLLLGPAQPGYFSTPSTMPGALIEPLYVTDPMEASVAASAAGQHAIAGGIAQAVGQYFTAAQHPA